MSEDRWARVGAAAEQVAGVVTILVCLVALAGILLFCAALGGLVEGRP